MVAEIRHLRPVAFSNMRFPESSTHSVLSSTDGTRLRLIRVRTEAVAKER
jgi:hypothetical protein